MKKWPKTAQISVKVAIYANFLLLRVQFKGGYYSPNQLLGAGSIQGRVLIAEIRYFKIHGIGTLFWKPRS